MHRLRRRAWAAVASLLPVALGGGVARAQGAGTPPPIVDNQYAVELFNGPFFGPSRGNSVAGANTANAAGVDATSVNPAAAAVRDPYSVRWFDYDVTVGVSFPGAFFVRSDFYNREPRQGDGDRTRNLWLFNLGASLQFGNLAISANTDQYQHELAVAQRSRSDLTLAFGRSNLVMAYGFWANQVVVGAGLRLITASFSRSGVASSDVVGAAGYALSRGNNLLDLAGVGSQLGVVVKPEGQRFRLGASYRSSVSAYPNAARPDTRSREDGISRAGSWVLPREVVAPWEIELGGALQLGPRPLNPHWRNPRHEITVLRRRITEARIERAQRGVPAAEERALRRKEEQEFLEQEEQLVEERRDQYRKLPRERLLLMASVLLTGSSHEAVSVLGFAEQQREIVGRRLSISPRLGLEAEPIPNRLIVRAGTYFEPSRYDDSAFRQHFTTGAEVRLFRVPDTFLMNAFDLCAVSFVDIAPRYLNFGASVSFWH